METFGNCLIFIQKALVVLHVDMKKRLRAKQKQQKILLKKQNLFMVIGMIILLLIIRVVFPKFKLFVLFMEFFFKLLIGI